MGQQEGRKPHVIGLTGSFGSGCTYIADHILVKKHGYTKLSLSDILKEMYHRETKQDPDTAKRRELQNFGDKVRKEKGPGYLAQEAIRRIEASGDDVGSAKWVVDSFRNPAEIREFREYTRHFFLFGVYADREVRWGRVSRKSQPDRAAFEDDDRNDTGEESADYGQRVGDCFSEADVVLSNNTEVDQVGNDVFEALAGTVGHYVGLVARPLAKQRSVQPIEGLMAMAYAASQRSSCMKKRVGAVIADEAGSVISSGYNEVPGEETPCERRYKECFRDRQTGGFFASAESDRLVAPGRGEDLRKLFRRTFKILDYCRALHAEESAIINLARSGRSAPLDGCILYTTTYPCRLCANKIVSVGIKHIVYLEPYPDQEAKAILQNNAVRDEFFRGVTSRAYFRIYGEEKR